MGSPPNCLRNRLDMVPCNIVNTQSTDVPQDKYVPYMCLIKILQHFLSTWFTLYIPLLTCSEYVVYSTRIRDNNGNNQLTCDIRSRDDILQSLPTIGGDPRILYLISAGYNGSQK